MTQARRWMLLVTVGAGLLLITLDNSILYTTLPTLTSELGASSTQSLWVVNAYPLVMAGLLLGAGTLGDRFGHSRMFTVGLAVFGASSLLAAFSPNIETLIAARAALAVGAAAMMPATLSLIRIAFTDERERNIAIAVWGSLSMVGSAAGPIVSGLLLEYFWWGSVFLINVPVVVAALIAATVIAPPNDADPARHWDLISSIQVMVGLVSAVVALKEVAHTPPNWTVVAFAVAASAIGLTMFARRQRTLAHPIVDFGIFRNRPFTAGVAAAAVAMFAIAGIQLITTQRYQLVEGFSPLKAGLLVAVIGAGCLPTSVISGAILHRTGLRPLIAGGLSLATAGATLAIVGTVTNFYLFIAGLVIVGAGIGMALGVASTAIIGNVPARRAGMASSLEEASYEFGSLLAVTVLGSLLTFTYAARIDLPAGVDDRAKQGLTDALQTTSNPAAIAAANSAFDEAFVLTLTAIVVVLAGASVVISLLLRHHGPGSKSQLSAEDSYQTESLDPGTSPSATTTELSRPKE